MEIDAFHAILFKSTYTITYRLLIYGPLGLGFVFLRDLANVAAPRGPVPLWLWFVLDW